MADLKLTIELDHASQRSLLAFGGDLRRLARALDPERFDPGPGEKAVATRIAEALEAIAKPRDQANLGLALKLKEAEERAAALLQMLRAVKEMLSQRQETTAGLESVMALLETVTP